MFQIFHCQNKVLILVLEAGTDERHAKKAAENIAEKRVGRGSGRDTTGGRLYVIESR